MLWLRHLGHFVILSDTPLTGYSLGSLVLSLLRAEQQGRVLKTDTHNYIGTPCTLSARAAHLIGGMSGTPLTCYSLGSLVQLEQSSSDVS